MVCLSRNISTQGKTELGTWIGLPWGFGAADFPPVPIRNCLDNLTRRVEPEILVVDDDRDLCLNMSDILCDQGYLVDTAHDGETALKLLERRTYHLALLDLRIPGMDGLTLCRELTRRHPSLVAVLVTGYPEDVATAEAMAAAVRRVIPKPVHVPRLLAEIERVLLG
jgi:DNA-binding response OmpR family regulator